MTKKMQAKQSVTTLVGAVILLLFALTVISFVPGTPTQALAPSMQQDPQPHVGFDKLEDSVLAGDNLNTGLFFANFPCIDQNDDGTCNSDDKFTTVTYRFDLVQGSSDGPNADHCEGQGFGSVSNFSPSQYSHWSATGAIPLSINRNCPPTAYTLKCSVTYTEPGSNEAIPLACNCGITIGPAQQPPTATSTPTETPHTDGHVHRHAHTDGRARRHGYSHCHAYKHVLADGHAHQHGLTGVQTVAPALRQD